MTFQVLTVIILTHPPYIANSLIYEPARPLLWTVSPGPCYNPRMRKFLAALLIISMLVPVLGACKSKDAESTGALDVTETAAPTQTQAGAAGYGHSAGVNIRASAAYAFEGGQGATLYGAIEYENTGDCPIVISKAHFVFTLESGKIEYDHVPPLGEYMVVLPGETSFEAVWVTGKSVTPGEAVTLSASLTATEAAAPRVALEADNLYVADNYPGFSTLSGRLSCASQSGCTMNVVCVGFYDEAGAFLGAWYFTKNAVLEPNESKNFVINMRDFPFSDLGARVAGFKSAAFGFDL